LEMRLNEKNALVEMRSRHYNGHLSADRAGMREEGGSSPPGAAAEGRRDYGATAAAQVGDGRRASATAEGGCRYGTAPAARDGHEYGAATATEDGHKF
jgi:hypothetical protein